MNWRPSMYRSSVLLQNTSVPVAVIMFATQSKNFDTPENPIPTRSRIKNLSCCNSLRLSISQISTPPIIICKIILKKFATLHMQTMRIPHVLPRVWNILGKDSARKKFWRSASIEILTTMLTVQL